MVCVIGPLDKYNSPLLKVINVAFLCGHKRSLEITTAVFQIATAFCSSQIANVRFCS